MSETAYAFEAGSYATKSTEMVREAGNFDKLMMELRGVLDEQEKAIAVLGERLTPVMRPEADKMGSPEGNPHPIRSPLADQISEHINRIAASTRRIHEFIHALDT